MCPGQNFWHTLAYFLTVVKWWRKTGEKSMRRRCIGQQNNKVERPPMRTPTFATHCMDLHGVNRNSSGGHFRLLFLGPFWHFSRIWPILWSGFWMPCLVLYFAGPCHLPKLISIICLARTLTNDGNAWQAHDKRMKHGSTWQTLHDKPWQNHE